MRHLFQDSGDQPSSAPPPGHRFRPADIRPRHGHARAACAGRTTTERLDKAEGRSQEPAGARHLFLLADSLSQIVTCSGLGCFEPRKDDERQLVPDFCLLPCALCLVTSSQFPDRRRQHGHELIRFGRKRPELLREDLGGKEHPEPVAGFLALPGVRSHASPPYPACCWRLPPPRVVRQWRKPPRRAGSRCVRVLDLERPVGVQLKYRKPQLKRALLETPLPWHASVQRSLGPCAIAEN